MSEDIMKIEPVVNNTPNTRRSDAHHEDRTDLPVGGREEPSQERADIVEIKAGAKEKDQQSYGLLKSPVNPDGLKPAGNLPKIPQREYNYYVNDNEKVAVKVIDKETGDVVREIPGEEMQKLSAAIQDVVEALKK